MEGKHYTSEITSALTDINNYKFFFNPTETIASAGPPARHFAI
jgi:hypothetical protein